MSKMNPNEKKENASKNENVNNEEATNLQEEQSNAADETAGSDNVSGEVEALQKKYNELNDSHLRLMAEFDNYRKRTMREKADLIKTGGEGALKNLLPIIDDFERALQNVRTAEDVEAVKEGVDLIFGKFMGYLSQQGVKPIEAVGKPFDPNFHNAVMHVEDENFGENEVAEEFQKGYMYRDSVVRHSMVKVAN